MNMVSPYDCAFNIILGVLMKKANVIFPDYLILWGIIGTDTYFLRNRLYKDVKGDKGTGHLSLPT